jgi:hypothetical protein
VTAAVKGSTARGPLMVTMMGEAATSVLKTEFKKHQTSDDSGVSFLGPKSRDQRIEKLFGNMCQPQKPQQQKQQPIQKQVPSQLQMPSPLDSMLTLLSMPESSIVQNLGLFEQHGLEVLARLSSEKWHYSMDELKVARDNIASLVQKLTKIGNSSLNGLKNRAGCSLVELTFLLHSDPVDWTHLADDVASFKLRMLQSDVKDVASLYKSRIGQSGPSMNLLDPLQKEAMELQAQVLPLVARLYHLLDQRPESRVNQLPEELCKIMRDLGQFEACGYIPIPSQVQVIPDFIDTKTRWSSWMLSRA